MAIPKGAYGQFIVKGRDVNTFLSYYELALTENHFQIKGRYWNGRGYYHKSIHGSSGTAFVVRGFVPFGSLMEEGNRYGAEAEIYQYGSDVIFRLFILPYMVLWDRPDIFLLSQGIIEKIVDDEVCREKLVFIYNRLASCGFLMYPYA
jgi:hypothetical protein